MPYFSGMIRSAEKKPFRAPPRWARILAIHAGDEEPDSSDDQRCGDHYISKDLECHQGGAGEPPGKPWHQFDPVGDLPLQTYLQKTSRRPPGQGGPVSLSSQDLVIALRQGKYALLSAGRNPENAEDMQLSEQQISARSESLRQDLVNTGLMFTPTIGMYGGGREDSFLVMAHDAETEEALALGRKYNQDSVIVANGGQQQMIFTSGKNAGQAHVGSGFEPRPSEATDFYTQVETEDGQSVRFTLNFDFDRLQRAIAHVFRTVQV